MEVGAFVALKAGLGLVGVACSYEIPVNYNGR